jgi:hypothetical protein
MVRRKRVAVAAIVMACLVLPAAVWRPRALASFARDLVLAAKRQDTYRLKQLLHSGPGPVDPRDLVLAAERGDAHRLKELLDQGADPNTTYVEPGCACAAEFPINLAIRSGNLEAVDLLLRRGARKDVARPDDRPFHAGRGEQAERDRRSVSGLRSGPVAASRRTHAACERPPASNGLRSRCVIDHRSPP